MTESREQVLVSILARLLLVATLLLQTLALHRTIEVMRTQARTIDALRVAELHRLVMGGFVERGSGFVLEHKGGGGGA